MTSLRGVAGAGVLLVLLAGCADGGAARSPPVETQAQAQPPKAFSRVIARRQALTPSASAYIAMPADARRNGKLYTGSGRAVAFVVGGAFMRRLGHVEQAEGQQTYEEALSAARRAGATYLVLPEIAHWVDHGTKWAGRPDRADVRIRIIETASESVIASGRILGRNDVSTRGAGRPEDLLPDPAEEYVSSLF